MGIFNDFIRAFGVMFLGLRDNSKAYSEDVEAAERYVRWGRERGDMRDYNSAMEHCKKLHDDDSPKPEMCVRKYTAMAEAAIGIIHCEYQLYTERNKDTIHRKGELKNSIDDNRKRVADQQERIRLLEEDGSMIKAKEAQQHLMEIQRVLEIQEGQIGSGDFEEELQAEYQELQAQCRSHQSDFDLAIATLLQADTGEHANIQGLVASLRTKLQDELSMILSAKPGA